MDKLTFGHCPKLYISITFGQLSARAEIVFHSTSLVINDHINSWGTTRVLSSWRGKNWNFLHSRLTTNENQI